MKFHYGLKMEIPCKKKIIDGLFMIVNIMIMKIHAATDLDLKPFTSTSDTFPKDFSFDETCILYRQTFHFLSLVFVVSVTIWKSRSQIFHTYGDVTIVGERLQ